METQTPVRPDSLPADSTRGTVRTGGTETGTGWFTRPSGNRERSSEPDRQDTGIQVTVLSVMENPGQPPGCSDRRHAGNRQGVPVTTVRDPVSPAWIDF